MEKSSTLTHKRQLSVLRDSMGPQIRSALDDPNVVEVMANPNGKLWVERSGEGMTEQGLIKSEDVDAIIRLVANHMEQTADSKSPSVSGTIPGSGERFEGTLPPTVSGPCFAIRKPSGRIYTLDHYVEQGCMSYEQACAVRKAVESKLNIIISGGTGTGKTTFANAVLAEPSFVGARVILIEDTRELQCSSPNLVRMYTSTGELEVTLAQLVKKSLRMRPDRIVVGEVRGGEALYMLNAMNTGHPGSLTTLHANSAADALHRLEDMVGMVSTNIPYRSIASAVDLIVHLERCETGRRVESMCRVEGYRESDGYEIIPL